MRSASVFLLVFLPGLLAVVLLWGPGRERDEAPPTRRSDEQREKSGSAEEKAAFASTQGRGTFFIKLDQARVRDRDRSYPSTYYWLGAWNKALGAPRFDAKDVLVLRNPRPRTEEDLASLFIIATDEDATERFRKMEEARTTTSHLRANRARFLGAERIEDARTVELEGDVAGRILGAKPGSSTTIEASRLDLHFEDKRLQRLVLPEEFRLRNERVELDGRGFDLVQGQSELAVERAKRLVLFRPAREGREASALATLTTGGRLVFRPETTTPPQEGDLFRDFDFAAGSFSGDGGVTLDWGDLRIEADRFRGAHGRDEKSGRPRLRELILEGGVLLETPDGFIRGDRLRFETRDGEIAAARVEGRATTIAWGRPDPKTPKAPFEVQAHSERGLLLKRTFDARGATRSLQLEMRQGVRIALANSPFGPLQFKSDEFDLSLGRGAKVEGRPDRLHPRSARLGGGLSGGGEDIDFDAREITLNFDRDQSGNLTGRTLELLGPATLEHRLPANKDLPARVLGITAADRVGVYKSEAPFSPLEAEAAGTVVVTWQEGENPPSRGQADLAKLVLLDAKAAPKINRLQRLVLTGSVLVTGHQGHALRGDHLDLKEGGRSFAITASPKAPKPARLTYAEGDRRQVLRAHAIRWSEDESRLVAEGKVHGNLIFPALILTGEDRAARRRARENLDAPPSRDRDWTLEAERAELHFDGALPLLRPDAAKRQPPRRIRDATARGAVTLRSADHTIEARELYLDPRRKTGWASGAPLVVTFKDRYRDKVHENRLTSDRLDIRPEWTLLQGHSDVVLHLVNRSVSPDGSFSESLERIHVACTEEVVLKERIAFFSGHTVFDRGDPERGGFRVTSDKAVAYLAETISGAKKAGLKRLERVEGTGHVNLRWGELTGQGDKVTYLVGPGRVVLGADKGRQCTMRLRGNASRHRSLSYDQRKGYVETLDTQGVFRRPRRSGGKGS